MTPEEIDALINDTFADVDDDGYCRGSWYETNETVCALGDELL